MNGNMQNAKLFDLHFQRQLYKAKPDEKRGSYDPIKYNLRVQLHTEQVHDTSNK